MIKQWLEEILVEMRGLKDPKDPRWKPLCDDFIALAGREPLIGDLWGWPEKYDFLSDLRAISK